MMPETYTLKVKDRELLIQWQCEAEDRVYFNRETNSPYLLVNRIEYLYSGYWTPYDGLRVVLRRAKDGSLYSASPAAYQKARELLAALDGHFRQRIAEGAYSTHIQAAVQHSIANIEKQMAILTKLRQSLQEVGERADEVTLNQRELEILGGVYFHDTLYRVQGTLDKVLREVQE